MQSTDGVHAFRMADKIARKEDDWQVFINDIADNSIDVSFFSEEGFTEIALATMQSLDIKSRY